MEANPPPDPSHGRVQPLIRSFFQPRQPNYTPPPSSLPTTKLNAICPPKTTAVSSPSVAPPKSSSAPSLEQRASITSIQPHHITPLRRINSLLLPISYPHSFYHKALEPSPPFPSNFSRLILWNDPSSEPKVIGGLVCRLDPSLASDSTPQAPKYVEGSYDIYIQSLALLSPYREKGLAAQALDSVVQAAIQESRKGARIAGLYAHVWTENTEALEWYAARGFKREEPVIPEYYRRLKPDTAWILRRRLNPSDHLAHSPQNPTAQGSRPAPSPITKSEPPAPTEGAEGLTRPPNLVHARSFQERGPDTEWNDLPEDVLAARTNGLLKADGSATSSRSSSRSGTQREKKKRVYPAAAFGS